MLNTKKGKISIALFMLSGALTGYGCGFGSTCTVEQKPSSFLYEYLGMGYGSTNYAGYFDSSDWTDTKNENGGLAYNGAVGYQFSPNVSLELGLGYLAKALYHEDDTAYSYKSWYGDLMAKFSKHVSVKSSVYIKGGLMYRAVTQSSSLDDEIIVTYGNDHYYAGMFGIGGTYDIDKNFYVGAEYDYLVGASDSNNSLDYPGANVFTMHVGYRFIC